MKDVVVHQYKLPTKNPELPQAVVTVRGPEGPLRGTAVRPALQVNPLAAVRQRLEPQAHT